jgi:hypothetical protein
MISNVHGLPDRLPNGVRDASALPSGAAATGRRSGSTGVLTTRGQVRTSGSIASLDGIRAVAVSLVVMSAAAALSASDVAEGRFSLSGLLSVLLCFGSCFVIAHHFHGLPGGSGLVWSLAVEEAPRVRAATP